MTFFILLNQMTTLFVSLNLLTTLSFESEIESYLYGGSAEEVYFRVTNKNKTLAIKALMNGDLSNLLVITKQRKYYFDLSLSVTSPHQFIEISRGMPTRTLKRKLQTNDFEILEGNSSMLFVNRKKKEVMVNGIKVRKRQYLSKGVPIIYEGKRILN